jgi:hypothetical protein
MLQHLKNINYRGPIFISCIERLRTIEDYPVVKLSQIIRSCFSSANISPGQFCDPVNGNGNLMLAILLEPDMSTSGPLPDTRSTIRFSPSRQDVAPRGPEPGTGLPPGALNPRIIPT